VSLSTKNDNAEKARELIEASEQADTDAGAEITATQAIAYGLLAVVEKLSEIEDRLKSIEANTEPTIVTIDGPGSSS